MVKIAALKRDWNAALPSRIEAETGSLPSKVTWDDAFVEEMKRTIKACKLFLFLPIFNMADTGLNTPQGAMGAAMTTNGAPNDLLNNFNQICIIALIRALSPIALHLDLPVDDSPPRDVPLLQLS